MRSFEEIFAIAAQRKGEPEALEQLLSVPGTPSQLERTMDAK